MPNRLRIGSRGSPLALTQTGIVRDAIAAANPGLVVDIEIIRTTGDRQQEWAAPPAGPQAGAGKGIFVKEIEEALLDGRVDVAIHSLKDLPTEVTDGLVVAATPRREDPRDVLVARERLTLLTLPSEARVGTGSPRRISQLRQVRPDLEFVPIRGNVDTRLRKVRDGELDAVVLAAAGLKRLGLLDPSWILLPHDLCLPAVAQGALAVQGRVGDERVRAVLEPIHDAETAACVEAERAFLAGLGGGCQVPVAALAVIEGGTLRLSGVVCDPAGTRIIRVREEGSPDDAVPVGRKAAASAIAGGAAGLIGSDLAGGQTLVG
jgi:hydroxymethylbilane synthase